MPTILKAHRISNPGKKKRRKLTAKQIKFFGTKRQRNRLKNLSRRKSKKNVKRGITYGSKTARKRQYASLKKEFPNLERSRKRNIGSILSVGLNPGRKRNYKRRFNTGSRKRNIAAGFYDEDGYFHPIRASYDYSPSRVREKSRGKSKGKSKSKRRKNPSMALKQTKSAKKARARYRAARRTGNPRRKSRARNYRQRRYNPSIRTITRYRNRAYRHHNSHHRRRNPEFLTGTVGMVVGVIGGATVTKLIAAQVANYLPTTVSNPFVSILTTGVVAAAQGHLIGKLTKNAQLGKNMMIGGFVVMALQIINQFVPSVGTMLGLSGGRGMGLIANSSFYTPQVNLPGSMASFVTPAAIPAMASTGMHGIYPNNSGSRMNFRRMGRMS